MEMSAQRMGGRPETAATPWSALQALKQSGPRHRDVADGSAGGASAGGYDLLRTQIQPACAAQEWNRIAVAQASPGGHAAAATALNLGLSEARLSHRGVVLADLDLARQPVSRLLSAPLPTVPPQSSPPLSPSPPGAGGQPLSVAAVAPRLALVRGTAAPGASPAETILSPEFRTALDAAIARLRPDLVLFNLPPLLDGDAGLAGLDLAQTVLMAIDGRTDTAADIRLAEARIAGRGPLLGLFLFDAEG